MTLKGSLSISSFCFFFLNSRNISLFYTSQILDQNPFSEEFCQVTAAEEQVGLLCFYWISHHSSFPIECVSLCFSCVFEHVISAECVLHNLLAWFFV